MKVVRLTDDWVVTDVVNGIDDSNVTCVVAVTNTDVSIVNIVNDVIYSTNVVNVAGVNDDLIVSGVADIIHIS